MAFKILHLLGLQKPSAWLVRQHERLLGGFLGRLRFGLAYLEGRRICNVDRDPGGLADTRQTPPLGPDTLLLL